MSTPPPPSTQPADSFNPLRQFLRNEHLLLFALAIVIGVGAAYAAIGFRKLIGLVQLGSFGTASESLASTVAALPAWQVVLVPAAGGLAVGLIVRYVVKGQQPHGVAEVIEATAMRAGRMTAREGLAAATATVISVGTGGSVGREGPVVHMGATIASLISTRLHLSRSLTLTLLGCGVASAVAASFNAPIAGAFFALEVVVGHYALSAFSPVVVASVAGTIIARLHLGDYPAFVVPVRELVSFAEIPAFLLLGVASAGAAILFTRSTLLVRTLWNRVPAPVFIRPAIAGLAIGAIALALPEILGVGYEATDQALREALPLGLLLLLLVAKIGASALCLGSGMAGGVFSPSLFIGAMLGGAFGLVAALVFPDLASSQGVYAIAGMGAVAGAVLGAPMSTILMIFELTGSYEITVVVMVATAVAALVTRQLAGRSYFHMLLAARGVRVEEGREVGHISDIKVHDVMTHDIHRLPASSPIDDIKRLLASAPDTDIVVVDEAGHLVGMVGFSEIRDIAFESEHDPSLTAADVATRSPVSLLADDDIATCLRLMDANDLRRLPVVEGDGNNRVLGVVRERDAVLAYTRALITARRESEGGG